MLRRWLRVLPRLADHPGRHVFEHVRADPDSPAELPIVSPPRIGRPWIECEDMLYIARRGYFVATGEEIPLEAVTLWHPYPELQDDRDFDDRAEWRGVFPA
jgi:hypothetical protein